MSEFARNSNCTNGCRIPFLSYFEGFLLGAQIEQSEDAVLLDSVMFSGFVDEEEYGNGILPKVETLLDKYGIDCVVFYPTSDGLAPTGKKATIRSKMGEGRVEIRLRFVCRTLLDAGVILRSVFAGLKVK